MQRAETFTINELDEMLDEILNQKERVFQFHNTYVGNVYTIFTTASALKSLCEIIGSVSASEWAIRCAATLAQPVARCTNHRGVETAIGYAATGVAFYVSPYPTLFTITSHFIADRVLDYGWKNTPEWCEDSLLAREIYAVSYVLKSEAIAIGAKKLEDAIEEHKAKVKAEAEKIAAEKAARDKKAEEDAAAAQRAADEAQAAADKAAEEAAAAKKSAEDAAAEKKAADEAAANKGSDDAAAAKKAADEKAEAAKKAAEEKAEAAKKAEEDALAAQNVADEATEQVQAATDIHVGWPAGFGWYFRRISQFIYLFESGLAVHKMGPDNQPHGNALTLVEAIIYFINGGCLIFSGRGKTYIFDRKYSDHPAPEYSKQKHNLYVPENWRDISISEITNKWFKRLGITAEIIISLVTNIRNYLAEQCGDAIHFSESLWVWKHARHLIKDYVKSFFIKLFQPITIMLPQLFTQSLNTNETQSEITSEPPKQEPLQDEPNQPIEPLVDTAAIAAKRKADSDFIKHVSSQFFGGARRQTSYVKLQKNQDQDDSVLQEDEPEHHPDLEDAKQKIENDAEELSAIQNARLERNKIHESNRIALAKAKARVAQLKLKKAEAKVSSDGAAEQNIPDQAPLSPHISETEPEIEINVLYDEAEQGIPDQEPLSPHLPEVAPAIIAEPIPDIDNHQLKMQEVFADLKSEITRVMLTVRKVKFGLYAGQLPADVRVIAEQFARLEREDTNIKIVNNLIAAASNMQNIASRARNYRSLLCSDNKNMHAVVLNNCVN